MTDTPIPRPGIDPVLKGLLDAFPTTFNADDGVEVGVAGEEHPDRVGVESAGLAEQGVAGHPGHPLVGEDDVDVLAVEDREGILAALGHAT